MKIFGGERKATLSREMTKKYEENIRGNIDYIYNYVTNNNLRGEFVLVVNGIDKKDLKNKTIEKWNEMTVLEHYNMYISEGMTEKDALKKVANDRLMDKSEVYKIIKVK